MSRVWVDADSCPVRVEVYRIARPRGVPVILVANRAFRVPGWVAFHVPDHPDRPDATDDHIAASVRPGEVVVTDDLDLARRCLEVGASVVGTRGRVFHPQGVERGRRLRDRRTALRARGVATPGPPPLTRATRRRFRRAVSRLLSSPGAHPSDAPPEGGASTTTRFRPASLAR